MQSPWLQHFIVVLEAPFSVTNLFCEGMFLLPLFFKFDRADSKLFLLLVIRHNRAMWIKQLCNCKVREFAMAFGADKFLGLSKNGPQGSRQGTWLSNRKFGDGTKATFVPQLIPTIIGLHFYTSNEPNVAIGKQFNLPITIWLQTKLYYEKYYNWL